jgi:hypothetical protein
VGTQSLPTEGLEVKVANRIVANRKVRSILRWIRVALVALFLLSTAGGLTLGAAQATVDHAGAARLVTSACPFKLGAGMTAGKNVYCGYLVVPEDRAHPAGPSLRLAVAVFKSPSARPAPAPLIFQQGGPGGAIVEDLGSSITSANASKIVGNQDLILIDQRGNGLSHPFLGCFPEQTVSASMAVEQPPSRDRNQPTSARPTSVTPPCRKAARKPVLRTVRRY